MKFRLSTLKENVFFPLGFVIIVTASIVQFGIIRNPIIFPFALVFIALIFLKYTKLIFIEKYTLMLFYLSIVAIFVSVFPTLYQKSIYPLFSYVFFSAAVLFSILLGMKTSLNGIRFFLLFLSFIAIAIILASLPEFRFIRFSGVFDNPNGMGRFLSTLAVLYISSLFVLRDCLTKVEIVYYIVLLSTIIILIFFTNSRAALGLVFIVPIILIILRFFYDFLFLKLSRRIVRYLPMLLVGISVILLGLYYSGVLFGVIEKFITTSASGDLTQGRAERWIYALNHISFFGHGHGFYDLHNIGEVHNGFISHFLVFGFFSAVFFHFLLLFSFFHPLFQWFRYKDNFFVIGLSLFIYYLIYIIVETGSAIFTIWLALFFLGFAFRQFKNRTLNNT